MLSYRDNMQKARAHELASDLQLKGGTVDFPPSLGDCIRSYWVDGQWRWHSDTTVRLGDEIDGAWIRSHDDLADLNVTRLDIYANKIETAAVQRLIALHPLKSFSVLWRTSTDELAESLTTERELRTAFFNQSDLTDAGFRRLPLEQLLMLGIDSTEVTADGLGELRRCRQLEILSISEYQFDKDIAQTRAGLPQLERLYVHGPTTDDDVTLLQQCRNLHYLHLTSSKLSKGGIESLDVAMPGCVLDIDAMDVY
jgi:hypothetical protein